MLGIKGNHAEEFEKANVKVKAIRIEANGKNKESISFPTFKYKELANESWDTSFIHEYFSTTKFVIFKSNGKTYNLLGAQMWNMPYNDLEETVKNGWLAIQEKIITGVTFTKTSNCIKNDLPKKSDNPIIHIRPHAQKAAFKLNSGYSQGNINRDANELPDGQWMTTHSFWINNDYILKQLKYK
jgi:DNA mismatch repair protein MutH